MDTANIGTVENTSNHSNYNPEILHQNIDQNNNDQKLFEEKKEYFTFKQRMKIRSNNFKERMKTNKKVIKERIKYKKAKIKQRIQEIKANHQNNNNSKVNQINHQTPHENETNPDKYCAHCGNRISFLGKFCPSCGVYQDE